MARPGNNKKSCEKYSREGRLEKNKKLRQERDEKRKAKFAKRREEGKAYEYKPNPYKEGTNEYNRETLQRFDKTQNKKTEFQRWRSIFAKLDNEIELEKKAAKAAE